MQTLVIDGLACTETEDLGADECRLDVYLDGSLQVPLRRSLKSGETWQIGKSFHYERTALVRLWDEDSPDGDDELATLRLGSGPIGSRKASLTGAGSRYELSYRVKDAANVDLVSNEIAAFRASLAPGAFQQLSRTAVIDDIESRLADPFRVNQGNAPLCGPAAMVFELVRRQPLRYVQICRTLFETGSFHGRTITIRPSNDFRASKCRVGVRPADWMLLGAMRDTANALFDVEEDSNKLVAGVSTPWEMKGWIDELLGYDRPNYDSTAFYGEEAALMKCDRVVAQGGVAFLMIDACLLKGGDSLLPIPTHWVTYLGGLRVTAGNGGHDSGDFEFDCYSWGRRFHVQAGEGLVEDTLYGVVTGECPGSEK